MKSCKESESEIVRLHIIASGRVQGVGYRWFVQKTARELGLTGWVKNLADGNVEVEAEGQQDLIDRFLHSLRSDHPYARVNELTVNRRPPERDKSNGFEIKF